MIAQTPIGAETTRGLHLARVIQLAQLLRGRRYPLALADIAHELREATGDDWHERTVRRDLELLEHAGLADCSPAGWRWSTTGSLFDMPTASNLMPPKPPAVVRRKVRKRIRAGKIAETLRGEFRRRGLSANQAAKETGIPQNCLSRFLRGEGTLHLVAIEKLAAYFGLSLQRT